MLRRSSRWCVAIALLLLAGCQTLPEIPYDHASAGEVKTIGVVTPSFPDGPRVVLASSIGQSFGLIGALIDAGMQATREAKFREILASQQFSAPDTFTRQITAGLTAHGYHVSPINLDRQQPDFSASYPTDSEPKVDAYLDIVVIGYGYIAAGIGASTPYRPAFAVKARLVRTRDLSLLMQDAVYYYPIGPTVHGITIAPDPAYAFEGFATMESQPVQVVKGLQAATEQCAQTITSLLK